MSHKIKTSVEIDGSLSASQIANATTDTDKFLVSDSGVVKYRTGAEILSDLGVAPGTASRIQHQVKAGVAINKGQAVYVTGADGTNMIVGLASNASESTSSKTMGLLNATVAINGFADVIAEGLLSGLNTIGANAGDPVWLGIGGNLIYGLANKPYAPNHLVFIGIVTRVNANNGEIFVKVQNGFELDEIHDVDLKTTTKVNGHLLGYNGSLWVNKTIAEWLGYTPYNASNPAGYISSYTETDTLASVTARGASTSTAITLNTGNNIISTSTWEKLKLVTTGVTSAARQGSDGNGLNFTSNALWNSGWSQDDSTKKSMAYIQHLGNGRHEFRTSVSGGTVSWVTGLTIDESGANFNVPLTVSSNLVWHAGNLTNLNQLTNGPGYITGYTETDTLASVTGRGNTTTSNISANGVRIGRNFSLANRATVRLDSNGDYPADVLFGRDINYADSSWNGVYWSLSSRGSNESNSFRLYRGIANTGATELVVLDVSTGGSVTASGDFRTPIFYDSNNTTYYLDPASTSNLNALTLAGTFSAPGYNKTNWDTAYGWGNHASAGYAASGHTHDLGRYSLRAPALIDSVTASNFRTQLFGSSTSGYNISTARFNTTPGLLSGLNNYGTMMAWSGSDTHGFLAIDYAGAGAIIGGGNADNINWTKKLAFLDDTVPNNRTITINGTSYDLSANRSWTVTASETDTLATVVARGDITNGGRPIRLDTSGGGVSIRGSAGGWATGYYFMGGTSNTYRGGFGALGDNDNLTNYWIGPAYNNFYTYIDASQMTHTSSMRAPIFYDSNNTGYYLDPNGTSNLNDTVHKIIRFAGVGGDSGNGSNPDGYAIYQQGGSWTHPYPDLCIGYHTGIKIGAYYGYNGTRFYNNSDWATITASVNDGDNNFRGYYDVIAYASDRRLKHKVKPIDNALSKVKSLTGMTYQWNEIGKEHGWDPDTEAREAGVFAQDVQAVLPEAVRLAPFDDDHGVSRSGESFLTVKYDKIVPLLIEAIKEQQTQIEELKELVKKLINKQ